MDLSSRYRSLKARAQKQSGERTRPRLQKNRRLLLESLDQRMLMAADTGMAVSEPDLSSESALIAPHAFFASQEEYEQSDQYGHGHDHSHDPNDENFYDHSQDDGFDVGQQDDHECGPGCTCGRHSPNLQSANTGDSVGEPNFSVNNNGKWDQPGGLGTSVTITYSYAGLLDGNFGGSLTTDQLRATVEEALGVWSTYSPLNFVEVEDAGPPIFVNGADNTTYRSTGTPDIRIGHHDVDGRNGTLGYAYFPSNNFFGASGDIHLDTQESWTLGNGRGTDLLEVLTHEVGHALGLGHSDGVESILNSFHTGAFSGPGTSFLYQHDIDSIRSVYGSGSGSVTPIIFNDPPVIAAIDDVTVSPSSTEFIVAVNATDPDGDDLTYDVTATQIDPLQQEAYRLDQEYRFRPAASEFFNARGHGEKYFHGNGSQWFFILEEGSVHRWTGSIAGSPQIGQLDSGFHETLSKLTQAQSPEMSPVDISFDWSGTDLAVSIDSDTPESFVVTVVVSDQHESSTETFAVSILDTVPTIEPIADQAGSIAEGSITVGVFADDADGESLQLSATASAVDPLAVAAFELRQEFGFRAHSTEAHNFRGHGEKYFVGGSSFFFILPDGAVHRWNGSIPSSPQVGQLDSSYHSDLSTLLTATRPNEQSIDVGLSFSGNNLTVDWPDGFSGSFVVTATASDQRNVVSTSFSVEVANRAPELEAIADQNVSVGQPFVTVPVSAVDPDGNEVQLSANVQQIDAAAAAAFDLRTEFGFRSAGRDHFNARGFGERYFFDRSSRWFFALPDGGVYRWTGSIAGSTLVGNVDPSYHEDLNSFLNIQRPTAVSIDADVSFDGNDLNVSIPDQFVGSFDVTVTATDGVETVDTSFTVTVSNQAPTLAAIPDQRFTASQSSITLPISASDLDGDTLQCSATASSVDQLEVLAYELNQQHGFFFTGNDHFNSRGHQARYFRGSGSAWHFILPNGEVYRWTGSVLGSTLIGELDSSYHANVRSLTDAAPPRTEAINVNLTWTDNRLTIDRPADFVGSFTVNVQVTDGAETAEQSFEVTVGSSATQSAASRTLQSMSSAVDQIMSQLATGI